jgi:hypothetical protein
MFGAAVMTFFLATQNSLQWFICCEGETVLLGISYRKTTDRIFNYKEYSSQPAHSISHNSKTKHFYFLLRFISYISQDEFLAMKLECRANKANQNAVKKTFQQLFRLSCRIRAAFL